MTIFGVPLSDLALPLALVAYLVLMRVALPKLGVPT